MGEQRRAFRDVGTWLARQRSAVGWAQLAAGHGAGAESGGAPAWVSGLDELDAFGRGLAAAHQYLHREGHVTVPRKHEELLHPAREDGTVIEDGAPVPVRLGVWLTNQKTRRAKLSEERRTALAELGLR